MPTTRGEIHVARRLVQEWLIRVLYATRQLHRPPTVEQERHLRAMQAGHAEASRKLHLAVKCRRQKLRQRRRRHERQERQDQQPFPKG